MRFFTGGIRASVKRFMSFKASGGTFSQISRLCTTPRSRLRRAAGLCAFGVSSFILAGFKPAVEAKSIDYDEVKHRRTLRFALSIAAEKVFPNEVLLGGRAVGTGYLYEFASGEEMSNADIAKLSDALDALIYSQAPITLTSAAWRNAVSYFKDNNFAMSEKLLQSRTSRNIDMLVCDDKKRLQTSNLYDCCGCLQHGYWSLKKRGNGVLLIYKEDHKEEPALAKSIGSKAEWGQRNGVTCLGDLNMLAGNNRARKNFILAAEFMQEAKIVDLVKAVKNLGDPDGNLKSRVRVVCIAGPTSSGKTTFAAKLSAQLRNHGMPAYPLTVDHYYLPLDRQPKYQLRKLRSDVDYDHIESMDIDLVNKHIANVIKGEEILTPKYNMKTGYRDEHGSPFKIPKDGILVIEGIHALNPTYTASIPRDQVFKVFLSPLTALSVDETNTIKSTDNRLLRRMSRDYLFRGNPASRTLSMWHNVRRGERTWIFPYQNDADYVMNSAHEYELCVLKPYVEPILRGVNPEDQNFEKAQELLGLLDKINSWNQRDVPSLSLLREFIGNGSFDEH